MFKEIFLFEFKYWFKRPAFYIYFSVIFAISFLIVGAVGGLFESATSSIDHGKSLINSPSAIYGYISQICSLGFFIIAATIGASVYRDYQNNVHSILFTMPISKWGYMGGRFISSLLITTLIFFSIGLAAIIALHMPWVDSEVRPTRGVMTRRSSFCFRLSELFLPWGFPYDN